MNMCLLEVAMYEKCRSSHFQSERGVKSLRTEGGVKNFRTGGGGVYCLGGGVTYAGGSVPHYMPCTYHEFQWDSRAPTMIGDPVRKI